MMQLKPTFDKMTVVCKFTMESLLSSTKMVEYQSALSSVSRILVVISSCRRKLAIYSRHCCRHYDVH